MTRPALAAALVAQTTALTALFLGALGSVSELAALSPDVVLHLSEWAGATDGGGWFVAAPIVTAMAGSVCALQGDSRGALLLVLSGLMLVFAVAPDALPHAGARVFLHVTALGMALAAVGGRRRLVLSTAARFGRPRAKEPAHATSFHAGP